MRFDLEGHILLSPKEVEHALMECEALVHRCLIPGTPLLFGRHEDYHAFLSFIADELCVPPMNVCVRGSGKLGFSIAPRPDKLWMAPSPDCDVDVGIVDIDYFNIIDREVRRWMRQANPRRDGKRLKSIRLTRMHDYFRYFDLPESISVVAQHNECFRKASDAVECVNGRIVTAFIYRDWWSVCERYKHDLRQVKKGLDQSNLPAAPDEPRPYEPPVEEEASDLGFKSPLRASPRKRDET